MRILISLLFLATVASAQLRHQGRPYQIKGVGGDAQWELLAKLGGNSVRTWGHEKLGEQLELAQKLGLTITAGIWLGQVRQGFDWSDAASLIKQREIVRAAVLKHKDHPALLMWALGNEMEDAAGKNGAVWSEINNLARMVKQLDPAHPTMTVIAEIGGEKVRHFHALCPDVDILGINSYAGAGSLGDRYVKAGGTKPYVLTEFGPPGIWEIKKDENGAFRELTSTEKAAWYRTAYQHNVINHAPLCVGSYAFLWGQKQEVTATWFSLLHNGARLGAVDTLSELWTGKSPANRCPEIVSLTASQSLVKPGAVIQLALKSRDAESETLKASWALFADEEQYGAGGDAEAAAARKAQAILQSSLAGAEVKMPDEGGLYRVFVSVTDGHGGAAVANVPVRVDAPVKIAKGGATKLPLIVYAEAGDTPDYIPSGWMGDTKSMQLDPACATRPKSGKTCLRCDFTASSGWGGVMWQHPAQDWGDQRGGFDLTGAKRLVFDARGETGGEEVTFGFGGIGPEKRYHDTAKRSREKTRLTTEWQTFEIKLDGLPDLTRIKTGFLWSAASSGKPFRFYLDNIRWE
ncbi:MAG: hypothetical protein B9S33_01985 [Pedosphaera sp. Tous-C6FEB]|nr:MAG: hypothetical protein B9S33_01985 [Pedosphaera sp. Tous-C6FEB]